MQVKVQAVQRLNGFIKQANQVLLFFGEEDLDRRMEKLEGTLGELEIITRAEPGLVDRVVHWLNPVNRNETIIVARIDR